MPSYCRSADYTMVWNVLDYVALTIPVSKVDQTLDSKRPPHKFLSEIDQKNYESCACVLLLRLVVYKIMYPLVIDDPSRYANAPIAIQLVGRTLEEEAVIAMSEIVDASVKEWKKLEGQ